jgi:hypothetical protein
MAIYIFSVTKHIRDDMYKTESIDLELSDEEYRNINNDDEKYSKTSALASRKLGEKVQANAFPTKINTTNTKERGNKKSIKKSSNKKSFWKPIWAIPFKFIWWLIKLPFKMIFSK